MESGDLLESFASVVGHGNVLAGDADRRAFDTDWRGLHRGRSLAVVRPGSTREVSQIVRLCSEAGIAVVPQGGNTGLCAGATPGADGNEVILNLWRLRAVREIDTSSDSMIVEAGLTLQETQEAAAGQGRFFPLSIASEGSATIGGVISTNAGGVNMLRYGNMRELTLGLEAVLADGSIWSDLLKLRKNNTGYDLKQLFIGAEGTLGIVTAASLRLFQPPRIHLTFLLGLPQPKLAVEALHDFRQDHGEVTTSWELFSHVSVDLLAHHCPHVIMPLEAGHEWYLLGEIGIFDADSRDRWLEHLAAIAEASGAQDIILASSDAQRQKLWAVRETITEAERMHGQSLKHDISVPPGEIADFAVAISREFGELFPAYLLNVFGHIGDGNLHINAAPRQAGAPIPAHVREAITTFIYDETSRAGGSFSAEHGVGIIKIDAMKRYKSPLALEMMRRVRSALDPNGLFNPGRMLG